MTPEYIQGTILNLLNRIEETSAGMRGKFRVCTIGPELLNSLVDLEQFMVPEVISKMVVANPKQYEHLGALGKLLIRLKPYKTLLAQGNFDEDVCVGYIIMGVYNTSFPKRVISAGAGGNAPRHSLQISCIALFCRL